MIAYMVNGNISIFPYGDGVRKSTVLYGGQNVIQRYELLIGASLDEHQLILNGKPYTGAFNDAGVGADSIVVVDDNSLVSLIEIYSPENVLMHKWDFEGITDDERLSDKADTVNKLALVKNSNFKLTPV